MQPLKRRWDLGAGAKKSVLQAICGGTPSVPLLMVQPLEAELVNATGPEVREAN